MNRATATAFIDALFLVLLVLVLLPIGSTQADRTVLPSLAVEIRWPDGWRSDVDLWVRGPGDEPVGFTRKTGRYLALLRDDLGTASIPWRHEIIETYEIPDGRWLVNVHLYGDTGKNAPVPVEVAVWQKVSGSTTVIWTGEVVLERKGAEVTAVHFSTRRGRFEPGSIHHTPVRLIGAGS